MNSKNDNRMCQLHDFGLLASILSFPFSNNKNDIKKHVDELYHRYRNKVYHYDLKNNTENNADFKKYFYEPKHFYLFGHYDTAIISIIDEVHLSTRIFHFLR